VFATALVHRRRYDPARGSAAAWLTGLALNKLAQARRRGAVEARMCRRLGMRLAPLDAPEPVVDRGGELLAALPADQRRAVEARVATIPAVGVVASGNGVNQSLVPDAVCSRALGVQRPLG
jgi:DNA-directed RNA polymerase specialized sigma24 family protein